MNGTFSVIYNIYIYIWGHVTDWISLDIMIIMPYGLWSWKSIGNVWECNMINAMK